MTKILIDRSTVEQALEALELVTDLTNHDDEIYDAIDALRAALAEPQEPDSPERRCGGPGCDMTCCQPVEEPVAWRFEARHIDSAWAAAVTLKHPGPEGKYMRNVVPLYAAPPQRKPLPASEIVTMYDENPRGDSDMIAFARAIERAHGIKE